MNCRCALRVSLMPMSLFVPQVVPELTVRPVSGSYLRNQVDLLYIESHLVNNSSSNLFQNRNGLSWDSHSLQKNILEESSSLSLLSEPKNATEFLTDEEQLILSQIYQMFPDVDLNAVARLIAESNLKDVASVIELLEDKKSKKETGYGIRTQQSTSMLGLDENNIKNQTLSALCDDLTTNLICSYEIENIFSSVSFCVLWTKLETTAVLYDVLNDVFVSFNLNNLEMVEFFALEPFRKIQKVESWSRIHPVNRDPSRRFILAIVEEAATKKYFLSSFEFQRADIDNSAIVVDEHYLGIQESVEGMLSYIIDDENGDLYCVIFGRNENRPKKTFFHVVRINIDEFGKIQSEILANSRKIDDYWHLPFVFHGSVCFLPSVGLKNKMVTVTIDAKKNDTTETKLLEISTSSNGWPPFGIFAAPFFRGEYVYFYVFVRNHITFVEDIGEIWALNLNQNSWILCSKIMENVIFEWPFLSVSSSGILALHGFCANSDECSTQSARVNLYDIIGLRRTRNEEIERSAILKFNQPTDETALSHKPVFASEQLFCLHPNKNWAFTYDKSIDCFSHVILHSGKTMSKCFPKLPRWMNIVGDWKTIRAVETKSKKTFLLALIFDRIHKKFYLASFEVCFEELAHMTITYVTIKEHFSFKSREAITEKVNYANMIKDESSRLYCVLLCRSSEKTNKTWFHIVDVAVGDCGEILLEVITNGITVNGLWFMPFIVKQSIGLLPLNEIQNQFLTVPFDSLPNPRLKRHAISGDKYGNLPPYGTWSSPCLLHDQILYYIFDNDTKTAELWGLDINLSAWKKYLKFAEHTIVGVELAITQDDHMFFLGTCVEQDCEKLVHNYQPAIDIADSKIFLNIFQLSAFYSQEKVQIIYGSYQYKHCTVLLMKAMECIYLTSEKENILICVFDEIIRNLYVYVCFDLFGASFCSQNIILFKNSIPGPTTVEDGCTLFIDNVQSLSYEEKEWLCQRNGKSIVALRADVAPGLDQPRTDFSWHSLTSGTPLKNQSPVTLSETEQNSASTQDYLNERKNFVSMSVESMDQFYPNWFSDSCHKDTVCIPASLDLTHNRYSGPSDVNAAGFNANLFAEKRSHFSGQKAEDAFLHSFQKLKIGGVLVHGFDTNEYMRLRRMESLFKKWKIGAIEIDFLFIHSKLGIFVVEVKGAEKDMLYREAPPFKKAMDQLQKIRNLISVLFKNLSDKVNEFPINCVACFPFANIQQLHPRDDANVFFIDASVIDDTEKMKEIFLHNLSGKEFDESKHEALRKFTGLVAGYRSVDFMSAGYNALSVHKVVSNQSVGDGIFLTNEQQTIIECDDKRQIISGPKGSGKTLIIISKAIRASTVLKAGNVRVITAKSNCEKILKFFQSSLPSTIVRFPIINCEFQAEAEDDVFIDEASFTPAQINFFQERLHHAAGFTIVALPEHLNSKQILDMEGTLAKHNLSDYCYFAMKNFDSIRSIDFMSKGFGALINAQKMVLNQYFEDNAANKINSCDGVFLTNEQQTIIECKDKLHQIISGPPGTGKTLIILSKAMQSAFANKAGRVRIITANYLMCVKFRKFFEASCKSTAVPRFPIINNHWKAEPEDDIFIDEAVFEPISISFLQGRLHASGITVVALTGWYNPLQIASIENSLATLDLTVYHHFPMKTILRNTIAIYNEWKDEYPHAVQLHIGHSISGQIVNHYNVLRVIDALDTVYAMLTQYVTQTISFSDTTNKIDKLLPKHISIITMGTTSCDKIKSFLASKDIACGSIEEQLFDPALIAVTSYEYAMSFEWPIVIMTSLECSDFHNSFLLLSSSRCIARLIVIERDYMTMQHEIEKKLVSLPSKVCEVSFHTFQEVIRETRDEVGEHDSDVHLKDTVFAIIRQNYLPLNLQCMEQLKGCQTLYESLQKIASMDFICRVLLDDSIIRQRIESFIKRKRSMAERDNLPRLLLRLWSTISEQENIARWEILKKLVEKLAEVYDINSEDAQNCKEAFLAALEPSIEWNLLVYCIREFLAVIEIG